MTTLFKTAAASLLMLGLLFQPAYARDHDGDDHGRGWDHGRQWHEHYRPTPVIVQRPYYYAPAPRVVYYPSPPLYYYPQPAYGISSFSFFFK